VTFKSVFDEIDVRADRLRLYPKVLEISGKTRPDVILKKK